MGNPIYGSMSAGVIQNKSLAQQFREFRDSFKGDPQATINELISSGKVTQQQVNEATQMANFVKGLLKI